MKFYFILFSLQNKNYLMFSKVCMEKKEYLLKWELEDKQMKAETHLCPLLWQVCILPIFDVIIYCSPHLWSSGHSSWLHNGVYYDFCEVLTGFICYVEESRPPLWSSGQSSWLQNGVVLWFLRGTNWICVCYVEESRPSLWSSGQSSWL
jgi:hypothetical protein